MIKLIMTRLLWAFILIAIFSFLAFVMIHHSKGSVVFAAAPQNVSQAVKKEIESNLNLDKPLLEQYFAWVKKALKGDFSRSLISGESVNALLKEHLPNTLWLTLSAFILLFVLALLLGVLSAMFANSLFDRLCNAICMSFFALPSFATSLALILFFSVYLGILPSSGAFDIGFEDDFLNKFAHLILPVSALILSHLAVFLRFVRTSLMQSASQIYIEAAFARGFSKRRIYFHFVLKDALAPIITYFSASCVAFIMNAYVIESVFGYAGIGHLVIQSVIFKDYPLVLAVFVLSILAAVLINLFAEVLCQMLNSRTSYA